MNRYQIITSMEPGELAEFFDKFEEHIQDSCRPEFCEYADGEGNCRTHPEGACKAATLTWLLEPIEAGHLHSSADMRTVEDVGPYNNVNAHDDTGLSDRSGASRKEILLAAIKCVCTDRNKQYGEPEDNFECIAEYWNKYLIDHCVEYGAEVCITPEDVAVMMIFFKIARFITSESPTVDTFVDIAGYAACAGEICDRKSLADER